MPGDFLEKRAVENRILLENRVCPKCGADNLVRENMEVIYPIECITCGYVILPRSDICSGDNCIGETIYIQCQDCYKKGQEQKSDG